MVPATAVSARDEHRWLPLRDPVTFSRYVVDGEVRFDELLPYSNGGNQPVGPRELDEGSGVL
jgi:hypothetical protein